MALNIHINRFYLYVIGFENTTAKLLKTTFNCEAGGKKISIVIKKLINLNYICY